MFSSVFVFPPFIFKTSTSLWVSVWRNQGHEIWWRKEDRSEQGSVHQGTLSGSSAYFQTPCRISSGHISSSFNDCWRRTLLLSLTKLQSVAVFQQVYPSCFPVYPLRHFETCPRRQMQRYHRRVAQGSLFPLYSNVSDPVCLWGVRTERNRLRGVFLCVLLRSSSCSSCPHKEANLLLKALKVP